MCHARHPAVYTGLKPEDCVSNLWKVCQAFTGFENHQSYQIKNFLIASVEPLAPLLKILFI